MKLPDDFTYADFLCAVGAHHLHVTFIPGLHRHGRNALESYRLCCTNPRCDEDHPVGSRPLEGWCDRGGHFLWAITGTLWPDRRGCWWCGYTEKRTRRGWVAVSGQRCTF